MNNLDYTLYLCTDRELMSTKTLEEAVEQALIGGCTMIQLREKNSTSREFYETALHIKKITDQYHVPLIINDRVDIALAVDASGVHVGQKDLPASVVRSILGPNKIVGVSAATVQEAKKAQAEGASYLGVGAVFTTSTKKDTRAVSYERLCEIRKAVEIPMVAIGGINEMNVIKLAHTGINGIAVISSVIAKPDITEAARKMKRLFLTKENL